MPPVSREEQDGRRSRVPEQLARLESLVRRERLVQIERDRHVRAARLLGATWTELADVLGVSPQAVQQRYRAGGSIEGGAR